MMRQFQEASIFLFANALPRLNVFNRFRWKLLRMAGLKGGRCTIWAPIDVRPFGSLENLSIGEGSFVNTGFRCGAPKDSFVHIGKNCAIGPRVSIETVSHNLIWSVHDKWGVKVAPVRIGDRVWIGSGATILPGVEIGDDSVVGAGSVVTKSFGKKSVIAGVPARLIRENV